MNARTRTMRREVYEKHQNLCKAQIRKRHINQCREALALKLKLAGIILVPAVLVVAIVVHLLAGTFKVHDLTIDANKTANTSAGSTITVTKLKYEVSGTSVTDLTYRTTTPQQPISECLSSSDDIYYGNAITQVKKEMDEDEVVEEEAVVEEIEEDYSIALEDDSIEIVEEEEVVEVIEEEEPPAVVDVMSSSWSATDYYSPSGHHYTDEDYQYLLMAIVGESQNCSEQEQMYVGSVVINRLESTKYYTYASSIKEICLAPYQYTCFSNGGAYRTPTDLNIKVARELITNGSVLPGNVIFQSLGKQGDGVYTQIGRTYFCYLD